MPLLVNYSRPIACALALHFALTTSAIGAEIEQPSAAEIATFSAEIAPFLKTHCTKCHGPEKQLANLRLDGLDAATIDRRTAEKWHEILVRVSSGEMPPDDQPQPPAASQEKLISWIGSYLARADRVLQSTGGETVMRRLNRAEYNLTIRDLLGVNFTPADDFSADSSAHGFDNVGAALSLSPLHLEKYLSAARMLVSEAIVTGNAPPRKSWHFEVDEAANKQVWLKEKGDAGRERTYALVEAGNNQSANGMIRLRTDGWDKKVGFRAFKFPHPGEYLVRVRAAAKVPDHATTKQLALAKKQQELDRDLEKAKSDDERKRVHERWDRYIWPQFRQHVETDSMYHYGPPRMKMTTQEGVVLAEVDVDAKLEEPRVYEFRFRIPQASDGIKICNNYNIPSVLENFAIQGHDDFPRPELFIDWIELEGPVVDSWPPPSHQKILFDSPNRSDEAKYVREVLSRFASRAFRRRVTEDELVKLIALYDKVRPQKDSLEEAIQLPLVAVLTSPHFLFLVENPEKNEGSRELSDFELASRLSYFLWSTMPDERLFRLAASGEIRKPQVLASEVTRMLADEKSQAFVKHFTGQWLSLRKVGTVVPDQSLYPWYDEHLERSMIGETEAFFAHVLRGEGRVTDFLASDYLVINERMARFYNIPDVRGDQFRRIDAPAAAHRGGVLTQASILTITSNGTRTSPVVRGVWILEHLLGDPPPPPPPNVGDIAPKVPGIDKATVRVRLEAHRKIESCAACHAKIDPLGFALENYNAIGQYREREGFGYKGRIDENDPKIDASGKLPDGRAFADLAELQQILREDEAKFLKCFVTKLSTYALGRGIEFSDRALIEQLASELKKNDGKLPSLIIALVQSEAFRSR
ncbi:Protein of unknown function DUF1588 [Pirellula staleyi DSM 6068]|uniref:Cytochrome c domain-containing protein n=1 Tax=Pirellula staleyi (strain ATCC 27377 / DSM 6068 / ICPB 4128) TaxID=530564 RepID=D2R095_PIRSD|nr:DUF1592 domain-containing protein [Pirellula staleyi]ADB14763.1 Protein of unknown function DUF1588 [Pirellula staleyi DSM 6068]